MRTSVVMATYNGEKYLKEQLDSIFCQTKPVDEVIICDDGSKDGTIEIIEKYITEKNLNLSWKLIKNKKNLGYADNFHQGLALATGEYIFFADQDDVWCEDKVEEMTKVMELLKKLY